MRHTPAPRYKPDRTSTIPVVRSFYRQKPRRQHLCIVERLLDCCGECASPQFKLYTITLKHQREVFIVTATVSFCCAYLLPSEVTPLCVSLGHRHENDENYVITWISLVLTCLSITRVLQGRSLLKNGRNQTQNPPSSITMGRR